jgi:hypothetical protein
MENKIKELRKIINENEDSAELGCLRSRSLVVQALADIEEFEDAQFDEACLQADIRSDD